MLTRRDFLAGSAASAAMIGLGTLAAPGGASAAVTKPAKPSRPVRPTIGYAVGQKAPDLAGTDQYLQPWKLSRVDGWVLLDFGTAWCPPCNAAEVQFPTVVSYLGDSGGQLTIVDVLMEGSYLNTPSTAGDADRWSAEFGLERETVLHTGGGVNAALMATLQGYCAANSLELAYPVMVLIDPSGIVRLCQQDWGDPQAAALVAAIDPSLPPPPPLPTTFQPPRDPQVFSGIGSLMVTWLPASGLASTRRKWTMARLERVRQQMGRRKFAEAGSDLDAVVARLRRWKADPQVVSEMQGYATFLKTLEPAPTAQCPPRAAAGSRGPRS